MNNRDEIWKGCYTGAFDLITPESIAHPAKMSASLCFKIIEHLEELGLLKKGDTILDPMSGTGLTAICANAKGYKAVTVELEEKFIGFQKANKDYASRKLGKPLDWTIIQGDSRKLSELLKEHCVTVTSPPFAESRHYFGDKPPEFWQKMADKTGRNAWVSDTKTRQTIKDSDTGYGTAEGQIGNLPDKPLTVVSPPYSDVMGRQSHEGASSHGKDIEPSTDAHYGTNPANVGNLPDKPLTVMSPPYTEARPSSSHEPQEAWKPEFAGRGKTYHSETEGQIGKEQAESYLSAMRLVYAEIAKVSDVCVVVTKNPTRAGKLRRLDLDTVALLEEAGFTILCQHKALLFEETESTDLFGETHKKVKGRMSFFKRLSYAKGNAVAQWEDVIVAVKNGAGGLITVSSPPYEDSLDSGSRHQHKDVKLQALGGYEVGRSTPGQIGRLK